MSVDASSTSKPKSNCDVLSICGRLKIVDMIEIKNFVFWDCRVYGTNEFLDRELMKKKKKKKKDSSSVATKTAKITAIAHDKVLMKVEKALYF